MSGYTKKEFGDYQTPPEFCDKVCQYIIDNDYSSKAKAIIEPTCGVGNFLKAAGVFDLPLIGIECNTLYAEEAIKEVPDAQVITANVFEVEFKTICSVNDVLVIGNPPWVLNANLKNNLPIKKNFKGLRGIEAMTGSSNFDICEYIILQMIDTFRCSNSTIAMLCKLSVARNVILELYRTETPTHKIECIKFNSSKVFDVSVAACVLIIKLSTAEYTGARYTLKDFDNLTLHEEFEVINGNIKSQSDDVVDLEGTCQLKWRQGVKHDCSRVMELERNTNGMYSNKNEETFTIENDIVYPLVKSSHFKRPIISDNFKKYVIVTQRRPKEDTSHIEKDYPLTWQYLINNQKAFENRKSSIYNNSSRFSMFGVGDYSFAQYKVGVSGFYKSPLFCLLTSDKPVMTDDTAYFLSFNDYDTAYVMMLILNSQVVQKFLLSIAFIDNKRPYTVKLLSRLDLKKCIEHTTFKDLKDTEQSLKITEVLTYQMYLSFIDYINAL